MARRQVSVFSLSFLDAMTCGLGAVVLLYMVINASAGLRAGKLTGNLKAEATRLEEEVLDGHRNLVELRNSVREVTDETAVTGGLSRRLIETLEEIRVELATFSESTIAQREHINQLKADIKSLEEDAKRLSAAAPSDETPGDRVRAHIGDGDRQYLTGLKVGGRRIFVMVDSSASMLDNSIVNIIRRRNLPDDQKLRAPKWQQAVATVDWLSSQFPRDSEFQIYTFAEESGPVVEGTDGTWLDAGSREDLEGAFQALRRVVPGGGTNLYSAAVAISQMRPRPDNITLLVDGLPTQGSQSSRAGTISAKRRLKLFERAVKELPGGIPINVILFPMEGDPMAAPAWWKLVLATNGSLMSPAEDWP